MTQISSKAGPGGGVVVYETPDGEVHVDVRFERGTVWLTRQQMAELFGRDRSVIARHVRNAVREQELDPTATCAKFARVQTEGGRTVAREVDHYDLDAIVAVGYRVKSRRGAQFRVWATGVLREHMERGYTLNGNRLAERGVYEARRDLDLLARTIRNRAFSYDADRVVLDLISQYAETWRLLREYDENLLSTTADTGTTVSALDLARTVEAIDAFRRDLAAKGQASSLFGKQRGDSLGAILGNLEQTMFGEPLYRGREDRAAHLLYFVVNDHPFIDGNKRIGALLFLLYLTQEGMAHRFDPGSLTALTLLIAQSAPSDKDLMIRLVVSLLAESGA